MPPLQAAGDDGAAGTRSLRERISQLVGMSVAARLLGRDLAGVLAADARELTATSALREFLGCNEETAQKLSTALAAWLLERARLVAARCTEQAEQWIAEAHRIEGRLEVMEETSALRTAPASEPAGGQPHAG